MVKFSIILPVRNGGNYLHECVSSILSQTYTDFELIILENASTDNAISKVEQLGDERIKIIPAKEPLSIEENWARTLGVANGTFCTLIGHDDLLEVDFLQKINLLIDSHPDATLFFSQFNYINANGNIIRYSKPLKSLYSFQQFLQAVLECEFDLMGTGFVMRTADYTKIGGIPTKYSSLLFADFELWLELTKLGKMVVSPNVLFSFRIHNSTTTSANDLNMKNAFFVLLKYIKKLANENDEINNTIKRNSITFFDFHVKGIAHRMLRSDLKKREGYLVSMFLEESMDYYKAIVNDGHWNPFLKPSLISAALIDKVIFLGFLFRKIRQYYGKNLID